MTLNPIYKGMENGPQAINENFQKLFAVGDIHISTSSVNPAERFGGTWERFGKGRTLVSVDESDSNFDSANKVGGEKTHTLTLDEIPSHSHTVKASVERNYVRVEANSSETYGSTKSSAVTSGTAGGGRSHNNMPPYITVYMWVKVA